MGHLNRWTSAQYSAGNNPNIKFLKEARNYSVTLRKHLFVQQQTRSVGLKDHYFSRVVYKTPILGKIGREAECSQQKLSVTLVPENGSCPV